MARRLKALVMLLIVGFVLPVSGAPQRFCTAYLTWLMPGESCHGCAETSPGCDCHGAPAAPGSGCITVEKMLPDAVFPDAPALPALTAAIAPALEVPPVPDLPATLPAGALPPDRGPPPGPPLYLLQRSLLL